MIAILAAIAIVGADAGGAAPDYCEDFDAESCEVIKTIVEAKDAPAYCAPGFGTVENAKRLSKEQIRACTALAIRGHKETPEAARSEQRATAERDRRRRQRDDDSRALLDERWRQYRRILRTTEFGHRCGLIQDVSVRVAKNLYENRMAGELVAAGLGANGAGGVAAIDRYIKESLSQGDADAQRGGCSQLEPADRARLRILGETILRTP